MKRALYRAFAWLWDRTIAPIISWAGPRVWPRIKGVATRVARAFLWAWNKFAVPLLGWLWQRGGGKSDERA